MGRRAVFWISACLNIGFVTSALAQNAVKAAPTKPTKTSSASADTKHKRPWHPLDPKSKVGMSAPDACATGVGFFLVILKEAWAVRTSMAKTFGEAGAKRVATCINWAAVLNAAARIRIWQDPETGEFDIDGDFPRPLASDRQMFEASDAYDDMVNRFGEKKAKEITDHIFSYDPKKEKPKKFLKRLLVTYTNNDPGDMKEQLSALKNAMEELKESRTGDSESAGHTNSSREE